MHLHRRVRLPVVLCVLLSASAGVAFAGPTPGAYTRNVTTQELLKAGSAAPNGTWTLRVKARGLSLDARGQGLVPERAAWTATRVTVSDTPGSISLFCAPSVKGTYAWTRTGSRLAFRLIRDGCKDRAGVLAGSWKTSG